MPDGLRILIWFGRLAPFTSAAAPPLPAPPSPPRPRRRRLIYAASGGAAVVVVVLILIFWGVIPLPVGAVTTKVTVTTATLTFDPSDNPCFSAYASTAPVTILAGGEETFLVNLTDQSPSQARDCTVGTIGNLTAGFSVISANTPLRVPTSGKAQLSFTVRVPSSSYDGPLNMTAPVTFITPDVNVTAIDFAWSPSSNPCGVDMPVAFYTSFRGFSGSTFNDTAGFIALEPPTSCSVSAVSTSTPGFEILSASVPYSIPANNLGAVSFEILLPTGSYTGTLDVSLLLAW